ncbi:PAS domain S-box-containing protein [Belliella buryatensis]|uniref:histidine kinase n=1 Tax=Belliella buryatensis TaxID=1500549 RepID=A0A239F1T5_9BACT|nr:PAS domain S-box protein [Belliella buryatensis]SNS50054.1 PAS domain S-box-containing protein [Belliella buryatensis]
MNEFTPVDLISFFDQVNEPILVFAPDRIVYLNQYFKDNFDLNVQGFHDFFEADTIESEINKFFLDGDLPKVEIIKSLKDKSGNLRSFEWVFVSMPKGESDRLLFVKGRLIKDIMEISEMATRSKSANADLELVKSILRYNHDMVVILDEKGMYKFISSSIIEKLGVEPEKVLGKTYIDFINQGILKIVTGDFEQLLGTEEEVNFDFWIKIPGRKKIYIESYGRNLLKDPQIRGILFSARDITDYKKAEKSLQKRYELERLINRISKKFVNATQEQLDEVFNDSLRMLGEFEKADRAYIFLFHEVKGEIEYAYEWVADGVEPQMEFMKSIQITDDLLTIKSLKEGEIFIIPEVSKMDDKFAYEREIYLQQGIESVILIPIFSENKLIGFFGLDAVGQARAWHEKDEYVLRQLGDVYAGTFINRSIKKRLERNENLLTSTELLAKSGSWRYSNSKNRLFFSKGLNILFGLDEHVGSASVTELIKKIDKADRVGFLDNINQAINKRSSISGEFNLIGAEETKYISYTIEVRNIPGTSSFEIYGYCTDITDKRDAEKYLKLQSQILAQVNDAVYVTDNQLKVIYMNEAAFMECQLEVKTKFEGKITELFDFNFQEEFDLIEILQKLDGKDEFRKELVLKNIKGKTDPYELSVQVFCNDLKEPIGFSFLIRNLSQLFKQQDLAKKAKMIVENSSAILFTVDPNDHFRLVYITENIKQFGYQADFLLASGVSILDLIHPDDAEQLVEYHYAKKDGKGVPAFSGEYRIRKKDGTYRWVEDKTQEVYDSQGNIILHEGLLQDITERKKNREEIIRSQQRYRVLAANIPLTNVFLIDKNLTYIVAEGTNFGNWGMSSADFEGKSLEEIHKYNLHEIKPAVIRALEKREFVQKTLLYKKRVYEMTVRPIVYDGEVEYALGIVRDINEEYEAKENLRTSEEKYRTLVEESTEIIFSLSLDMELTYVSPNVKQFLGYEYKEVTGRKLTEFLHEDDLMVFSDILKSASTDFFEVNQYLEYRLKHRSGDYRVFSSNGRLIKDEMGNIRHYTGIARDITKLKEAQRELFHAKDRAEKASTIKSQFLSIMSHEIRTPMNAVIGMAHLLIEDEPRPDQLENLRTLQFSAENLLGLINDILDYSKIESGKIELERVAFDLSLVFNRIIHSYTYQTREKSLEVSFDVDGRLPKVVMGDPVRLAQVANNLISNAIKFTEKGFVRIHLKNLEETTNEVKIRFEFEDSGIGIPKEKLGSIFEAFTQASAETTRKYGGTGLGLAIVKRLVELFGGQIQVDRMPHGGTMFSFEIGFEKPDIQLLESKEEKVNTEKNLSHAKILVAEDNLVNQIMIKKFLNKWGVKEVIMANDGNEAIEAVLSQSFDLILLDLQMPEKDGFEVGEFIRAHKDVSIRNLPIIALTASSLLEVKDQLEAVGMNDYIPKPFNPDNLYAKIIKYLNV